MSDIIELNRDVESFIVQASATRTQSFKDPYTPLQFVHLADAHNVLDLWNRMVEYVNHYKNYISFALHTGDYCGNSQAAYTDFYNEGIPCERPILNCVGNHDTIKTKFEDKPIQPKEITHALLFNHTENWDVNFMDIPSSMTYYKDFEESNVRLIVLDDYYHIDEQRLWLAERLREALERNLCVITAMHETTDHVNDTFGVTFHSIEDYVSITGKLRPLPFFEEEIVKFIDRGGIFICNLAGHHHHDLFGLTDAGVLNVAVPCATSWPHWCDGKRIKGTRTYDCFNVVSVDANLHHLKLVRVGDNCDHFMRIKRTLCYDYLNRRVIFNG